MLNQCDCRGKMNASKHIGTEYVMKRVTLWGVIVVMTATAASCWLGISLDDYTSGPVEDAGGDVHETGVGGSGGLAGGGGIGGSAGKAGSYGGGGSAGKAGSHDGGDIGGSAGVGGDDAGGGVGGGESLCPTGFVEIPAGSFKMGSPKSELDREDKEVQRNVVLSKGFCMLETPVTQKQYKEMMEGKNPSFFVSCGDNCPVERVNWHIAALYCNKLSDKEKLDNCYECNVVVDAGALLCKPIDGRPHDCNGYRLPTEAEWEYAARASSTTAFYNGPIEKVECTPLDNNLNNIGWYCGNSDIKTHPVKNKTPNKWGLYDMSGNVWEWCHDWAENYSSLPVTDPYGPDSGTKRIARGGSYNSAASHCRCATRTEIDPNYVYEYVGFRPIRSLP